ncbi:MAG: TIGR03667 family PPOX class F420-dependent oxidoreductase [Jatrophihabitans sp.]
MTVFADSEFGERARRRLREEQLAWLVTVGADGTPQPNPVWFLWDGGDSALVYNRSDAYRLRHIDARPDVALHFQADQSGGDVVVLVGTAHLVPDQPSPHENVGYLAKYAQGMAAVCGSVEHFAEEYPIAVRIDIRRVRGF